MTDLYQSTPNLTELATMLGHYEHHIALVSKEYPTKRDAIESMWEAHLNAVDNWVTDAGTHEDELKEGPPSIEDTCEMFINMLS